MRLALKLEIKTIMHLFNVQAFLCSVMLNDKLLQEQESSLVIDTLTKLHLSDPQVRCVSLLTIVAL